MVLFNRVFDHINGTAPVIIGISFNRRDQDNEIIFMPSTLDARHVVYEDL